MVDAELLVPLAEIAGMFVGFGALIAVRSSGPTQPLELAPMRSMVSLGMLTIAAALAPRTLGGFSRRGSSCSASPPSSRRRSTRPRSC